MGPVRIALGSSASALEELAADVLARRLPETPEITRDEDISGDNRTTIVLGTPASNAYIRGLLEGGTLDDLEDLGPEGFAVTSAGSAVAIAANQAPALLFGIGSLLRAARRSEAEWSFTDIHLRDRPRLPVRNIYFADHMGNYYTHAPESEVRDYLEEMALWGYNELMTCLAVRPEETFFDSVARLHALEDYARALGMRAGSVIQSNTSFNGPPEEWKATPGPIPGAYDVCPSKPGAWEFLVEDKREYLALMQPMDYVCLWPYDGGGCYSEDCKPWAATFLRLSRDIAERAVGDLSEVRVSAWFFERDVPGEDDALFAYLQERPDWFHYIVAGAAETRRWVADGRTVPDPYRVLLFPDISMFDGIPWGGRGANPAPRKFAAELAESGDMLDGGIVYSEGRFDDFNKVLWARLFWDPDLDPRAIVREYCDYYFGSEASERVTELIAAIEEGMAGLPDTERWRRGIFHPEWDAAAAEIEAGLPSTVTRGWRWQMLRTKTKLEADYSAIATNGSGGAARSAAIEGLRESYDHLQAHLNLHDAQRSLATWFYAPAEEAFPGIA